MNCINICNSLNKYFAYMFFVFPLDINIHILIFLNIDDYHKLLFNIDYLELFKKILCQNRFWQLKISHSYNIISNLQCDWKKIYSFFHDNMKELRICLDNNYNTNHKYPSINPVFFRDFLRIIKNLQSDDNMIMKNLTGYIVTRHNFTIIIYDKRTGPASPHNFVIEKINDTIFRLILVHSNLNHNINIIQYISVTGNSESLGIFPINNETSFGDGFLKLTSDSHQLEIIDII